MWRDLVKKGGREWGKRFVIEMLLRLDVFDGMNILWIRSLYSTFRFAVGKFSALTHSTISYHPKKGVQSPKAFICFTSHLINPTQIHVNECLGESKCCFVTIEKNKRRRCRTISRFDLIEPIEGKRWLKRCSESYLQKFEYPNSLAGPRAHIELHWSCQKSIYIWYQININ